MAMVTISSREFNQCASEAKKAALKGPVFITDRGKTSHVLLSIDDYRKLTGKKITLAEALAQDDAAEIEFEAPKLKGLTRPVDLD